MLTPPPAYLNHEYWITLSDGEKIANLRRYAVDAWNANQTLAATVQSLKDRLAKIEAMPRDKA